MIERLLIGDFSRFIPPVNEDREHGPQPLDALMTAWGLGNHDLVDASTEQLTHKQVQRARTGRTLTLHMMQKATRALNIAIWYRLKKDERESYFEYLHKHLRGYFLQLSLRGMRRDRDAWHTGSTAISDRIRSARRRLGKTQKQLARILGVTAGSLLGWETGRRLPTARGMEKLTKVLVDEFASVEPAL